MMINIQLPIYEYQFQFTAREALNIPSFSGVLWHSVFGKALHEVSCQHPENACDTCPLLKQCAYPYLFRGDLPDARQGQSALPPHWFRHSVDTVQKIPPEGLFTIHLSLVGESQQRLSAVIEAMQTLAVNGLRSSRKQAELKLVLQKDAAGMHHLVYEQGQDLPRMLPDSALMLKSIPPAPKHVRLQFTSLFRFSGKASHTKLFLADFFLMMIIRRISSLQYYYTPTRLEADFAALKGLTQSVPVLNKHMRLVQNKELSQRSSLHQQDKAWKGYMDIDLSEHVALWPFLYLGQFVNVGKNASMGFGEYQLILRQNPRVNDDDKITASC